MVYSLAYRRPAYVAPEVYAAKLAEKEATGRAESIKSKKSGQNSGIPAGLAFDKIINGGTCPVSIPSLALHHHGSKCLPV